MRGVEGGAGVTAEFDSRCVPAVEVEPRCVVRLKSWTPQALRGRLADAAAGRGEAPGPAVAGQGLRRAAVLLGVVWGEGEPKVWLIERAAHLRHHAGQLAFPGGVWEPGDVDGAHTALREAGEELGLEPRQAEVLGSLPVHVTATGFAIEPVVAAVSPAFVPVLQVQEVAAAFSLPLQPLLDSRCHRVHEGVWQGQRRRWFSITATEGGKERFIWGATAAMLRSLQAVMQPS